MDEMNEEDIIVDVQAIGEKFEDKGYFRRLKDMFKGLGMPHDTPEYKLAKTELQRQQAPIIAFVSVFLFFSVLVVMSQMEDEQVEEVVVTKIQEPDKVDDPPPEDPPPPPPDPEPITPDIDIEVTTPGPVSEMTPVPSPPSKQVSTKPAPENSVAQVISPVKLKSMLGSRNPGSIGAKTRGGNGDGDPTTEACVLKVLWWLKAKQHSDGSWKGGQSALANTALGVLTYLAHGEFPGSDSPYRKDFGPVMERALNYLIACVDTASKPVKMRGADSHEYAFLMATYALCEAYGMTRNDDVKDVALLCLERIVKGQSSTGGWDYNINPNSTRDDLSFAGWALQALKAGKMAGLEPEGLDACIKKAIRCLKQRNFKNGGFGYCAGQRPDGMTATGCLVMQLLGYGAESEVSKALDTMRNWKPAFVPKELADLHGHCKACPQYYSYYATQCKYQAGMRAGASKLDESTWFAWNKAMKALYPKSIIDLPEKVKDSIGQEHKQGYFVNKDVHTTRPYMDTCLAALQLMVYYRYLPTAQTKAGEVHSDKEVDSSKQAVDKKDVGVEVDF